MAERLGVPVAVDNDANAALVAEHRHGAARGAQTAALLTLGTGIGGGIMVDGKLVHGATRRGAERGHMVIDVDGPPCTCGNRGCLEMLVSGTALGSRGAARRRGPARHGLRALAARGARDHRPARRPSSPTTAIRWRRGVLALVGSHLGVGHQQRSSTSSTRRSWWWAAA